MVEKLKKFKSVGQAIADPEISPKKIVSYLANFVQSIPEDPSYAHFAEPVFKLAPEQVSSIADHYQRAMNGELATILYTGRLARAGRKVEQEQVLHEQILRARGSGYPDYWQRLHLAQCWLDRRDLDAAEQAVLECLAQFTNKTDRDSLEGLCNGSKILLDIYRTRRSADMDGAPVVAAHSSLIRAVRLLERRLDHTDASELARAILVDCYLGLGDLEFSRARHTRASLG